MGAEGDTIKEVQQECIDLYDLDKYKTSNVHMRREKDKHPSNTGTNVRNKTERPTSGADPRAGCGIRFWRRGTLR